MKDEKIMKHLEMIQGVINRMARNSFMLKAWTVTLVAAGLWLSARANMNGEDIKGGTAIIIVIVSFWWLDGYFLFQERQFRCLYNHIRTQTDTDFTMFKEDGDKRHLVYKVLGVCTGNLSQNTLVWFYTPLVILWIVFF